MKDDSNRTMNHYPVARVQTIYNSPRTAITAIAIGLLILLGSYIVFGALSETNSSSDSSLPDLKLAIVPEILDSNWTLATMVGDYTRNIGSGNSIALDSKGFPHVVYRDVTRTTLGYAWFDGTSWSTRYFDGGYRAGWKTSIAVDSRRRPHIAYPGYGAVNYAIKEREEWVIQRLFGGVLASFKGMPIVLDSNDLPHIAYWDYKNREVKRAYFDGEIWHSELVERGVESLWSLDLALDDNNTPSLCYSKQIPKGKGITYASLQGEAPTLEMIDVGNGIHRNLILRVGNDHAIFIAYTSFIYDTLSDEIRLAIRRGKEWEIMTVYEEDSIEGIAFDLDSNGHPIIMFQTMGPRISNKPALLYIARFDGQSWGIKPIMDCKRSVSNDFSLAVDSYGGIHVAYRSSFVYDGNVLAKLFYLYAQED